jgi:hypothetical protein
VLLWVNNSQQGIRGALSLFGAEVREGPDGSGTRGWRSLLHKVIVFVGLVYEELYFVSSSSIEFLTYDELREQSTTVQIHCRHRSIVWSTMLHCQLFERKTNVQITWSTINHCLKSLSACICHKIDYDSSYIFHRLIVRKNNN